MKSRGEILQVTTAPSPPNHPFFSQVSPTYTVTTSSGLDPQSRHVMCLLSFPDLHTLCHALAVLDKLSVEEW
jgi:hypothetical protein